VPVVAGTQSLAPRRANLLRGSTARHAQAIFIGTNSVSEGNAGHAGLAAALAASVTASAQANTRSGSRRRHTRSHTHSACWVGLSGTKPSAQGLGLSSRVKREPSRVAAVRWKLNRVEFGSISDRLLRISDRKVHDVTYARIG
jgi:hypothetical protein